MTEEPVFLLSTETSLASTQTVPLAIDFSVQKGTGDTFRSPSAVLTDRITGTDVSATNFLKTSATNAADPVVTPHTQDLTPGHRYH